MKCDDIISVHIIFDKPPENAILSDEACRKGCYFSAFLMTDGAAEIFNQKMNADKDYARKLYLNNVCLFTAPPFPVDIPYTQIFSSGKEHGALGDAITEVQQICPGIKTALPGTPAFPFK